MDKAIVVGGNSGIGLGITLELLKRNYKHVYIIGKDEPIVQDIPEELQNVFIKNTSFFRVNFVAEDYECFNKIQDVDTLIITAGFGRVAPFEELTEVEIANLIKVNELAAICVIKKYYDKINSNNDFYCAVMGSIAGHVASPLFSVYGASKMGLCGFVENINIELAAKGIKNRILDVSPGSLSGTRFAGGANDMCKLEEVTHEIIEQMKQRNILYIPNYDNVYKGVIDRYRTHPVEYGLESYEYKVKNQRLGKKPQVTVGYLSGTFDLFHVGHLNLLRRAKECCDYLVVGVHKSGAWKGKETFIPFEERKAIVEGIRYVDKVIESYPEDADAYADLHYDMLFVGSDYKGTERFNRYEAFFKDKGVKIVYFPYTNGTSSTQLRAALTKKTEG